MFSRHELDGPRCITASENNCLERRHTNYVGNYKYPVANVEMRPQRFLTITNDAHVARCGMCFNLNHGISSLIKSPKRKTQFIVSFTLSNPVGTSALLLFPDVGDPSIQVWAPSLSLPLLLSLLFQSLPLHYNPA